MHGASLPRIIVDTDMASDCDDAGAIAVLHALADLQEAVILGIVSNNKSLHSIRAVQAFNNYYGRPTVPLGRSLKHGVGDSEIPVYEKIANTSPYATLSLKGAENLPPAYKLYRRLLAHEQDRSVRIVSIGHLNNLYDLLLSPPDELSPLSGMSLVASKLAQCVVMGGVYPHSQNQEGGHEHNFGARGSALYSHKLFNVLWPENVSLVFVGFELGEQVQTGTELAHLSDDNPIREAYHIHESKPLLAGRASWDQIAVLYSIRNENPQWSLIRGGYNYIHPNGGNEWRISPNCNHAYLTANDTKDLAQEIENLMSREPNSRPHTSKSHLTPS
ncbi:MAG: hypothetical protein AAF558_04950 [Verrucomicrobiota bacterium]